jgi:hypothetical protein
VNVRKYLELAAQVSRLKDDDRTYFHGAVGLRRDGVLVAACNGNPKFPCPEHHCEFRITRKLGREGTIFLVRTLADGTWANTTPCIYCQNRLRYKKVHKVYYTTGPNAYDMWLVEDNTHRFLE